MKKVNGKKLSFKVQYIIYAVLMALFIVWLVIGAQFVTSDSPGVVCFFGMSLPFLGIFGALGLIIRVAWKQHRETVNKKLSSQSSDEDK